MRIIFLALLFTSCAHKSFDEMQNLCRKVSEINHVEIDPGDIDRIQNDNDYFFELGKGIGYSSGCMEILLYEKYNAPNPTKKEIIDYAQDHIDLYGDLCAESSTGYEDMTGQDAHYEGVKCAAESIKWFIEGEM